MPARDIATSAYDMSRTQVMFQCPGGTLATIAPSAACPIRRNVRHD